ncbi:DNA methyltransferase [Mucilaginibacter gossypii]|uniref:DNA methyltransferase n=1 Tax=Mucilaginibacter gossypii TaxID=551996 RepID=UPI000DCBC6AA|nr:MULTISPECIES: DNA methyltransferase [Mucilaginibacter]QTE37506.1 DNA methyltransferase [Mucilaginibacter gossypii]RAV52332.1 DNA methylase N-4 [Mucilaginibacter rubeus]
MEFIKQSYEDFLKSKVKLAESAGFEVSDSQINQALKPHNRLMVKWLVEGGRRACFAAFGLHKTVTQLETIRIIIADTGGRGLIICPLGVRQEFINDAINILGWDTPPKFIRKIEEAAETGIYLTNYETVRDGKLDPAEFDAVSLDEGSVLRGLGGSKTFREFMRLFTGDEGPKGNTRGAERVKYRFVATATPSPNDYIELLAYADFLGVMDVGQAKTRFFKRDSTKADKLTIYAHKEEEFWLWVASWALFVSKPSDLTGNESDDIGYNMPPLDIRWHEIPSDHSKAGTEKNGQYKMYAETAIGLSGSAKEKRESLTSRLAKVLELRDEDPAAHRILWHDLEPERMAIERAIPTCKTVFGKQDLDAREVIIAAFSKGELAELGGKPCMIGSGTNLQKFCSWAIYLGIGFKFNDFIQSIHRLARFGQKNQVRIDLIYTEAERQIRKQLERKWQQHNVMVKKMTEIIKKFGLSQAAMAQLLTRKIGVERVEIKGERYTIVQNDNVKELPRIASDSVGLVLTSIPFANQYEYSPNYSDYSHTENTREFFQQMDYSTPEVFRVLMPGRIAAIHVKDRIIPGGLNGLGFQTVYPFHKDCIDHFTSHGFAYIGMKTIVTDVVRENAQTYRLGWTEQCKDGSKMGVGMPEYLLLFRKPPSDNSNAYADIPVLKSKEDTASCPRCNTTSPFKDWEVLNDNVDALWEYTCPICKESMKLDDSVKISANKQDGYTHKKGYSRSRWQFDAHGFTRSSGNRLLDSAEIATLAHDAIYKLFRDYSLKEIWDFEQIVKIAESLEVQGKLPPGFMLLQPQSWTDEVWTDITRMLTLNGSQWSLGKEMHICPMQFDIADRVINQMSNEGDIVLDYFGGLMTVPYRAILQKRIGYGIELNSSYFVDGAHYCKAAEHQMSIPTLFDAIQAEDAA